MRRCGVLAESFTTALQAGFDPAKLHFHGNNKSREEMAMAIKAGIGSFIADSERRFTLSMS